MTDTVAGGAGSPGANGFGAARFLVRTYRPADFDSLFALDQQCFVPEIAYSRDDLRYFLEAKDAYSLVAVQRDGSSDEVMTGFLIAQLYRGRPTYQARIITIDVAPAMRRRQLASQLMQACEEEMRRQHVQRIRLEVAVGNMAAQSFYRRRGYREVDTLPAYYPTGEDALAMQMTLAEE